MERSELEQAIVSWNNRFPLDRWWRNKHEVAFMSPVHRESSFLYQLFEFEEDKLFSKAVTEACTYNGKKYILPVTQHYVGFFYNKKVFAAAGVQPPSNWNGQIPKRWPDEPDPATSF